jgi:hypothetical protein
MHRLSTFTAKPEAGRAATIDAVVNDALRLDLRHRTGSGTLARHQAAGFPFSARTPLSHIAAACDRFFAAVKPDVVFCPGGVANGSYAVRRFAEIHGVRFASSDSGFGNLFMAAHTVAGHLAENADAHAHLLTLPPDIADTARRKAFDALARKDDDAAGDKRPLPPCDLLLPLGYDWDTVALGIGSLYETQDEWLRDTVAHVSRRHPTIHMVVRQHPYEAVFPSPENVALITDLARQNAPNLHIMRATEKIPPYGLLHTAKACVACQSTLLLEALMSHVPAVAMRDTYCVATGAVTRPASREAYFAWLDDQLTGNRKPVPCVARDAAALDYFVLESCAMEVTRFTPHASDMWAWLNNDPAADMESESMADFIRCVVGDLSFSTLKARRLLGLSPLPDGAPDPIVA